MDKRRWAIGIDPGLTETGVGLFREDTRRDLEPVEWATYVCPTQQLPVICRVVAMANHVINLIVGWIDEHDIEAVDISLEQPVYTGNPKSYRIQIQLYEEISSGLFHQLAGGMDECWLTEVMPATSKSLAGCSNREKPVEQSPFRDHDLPKATKEALADAWAHALGTWGVAKAAVRTPLHELRVAAVKEKCRGPESSD